MVIPYGTEYSATLQAAAWIPICCGHCGCTFAFRTEKAGTGQDTNLFWLDKKGAKEKAGEVAAESLHRELARAHTDPVPCPQCSSYQTAMLSRIRRFRRLAGVYGGLASAALWVVWTLYVQDPPTRGFWETGIMSPLVLGPLAAVLLPVAAAVSARNLNPKAYAKQHPVSADRYLLIDSEQYQALLKAGYLLDVQGS